MCPEIVVLIMWRVRVHIVRKAVFSMMAMKRMSTMAGLSPGARALGADIQQYKEESEKVRPRAPLSLALITLH